MRYPLLFRQPLDHTAMRLILFLPVISHTCQHNISYCSRFYYISL